MLFGSKIILTYKSEFLLQSDLTKYKSVDLNTIYILWKFFVVFIQVSQILLELQQDVSSRNESHVFLLNVMINSWPGRLYFCR